jgi:hypothetical protein
VVPLASGVTPKAIAYNMHTGYAIGSDGNIYAWGYGLAGELGDGTTGDGSPPVVVSLPPGSTPESLGTEPGSTAGYAIASVPNVAPTVTTQPTSQTVTAECELYRGGKRFPDPDGAVAGLHRPWDHLLISVRSDQRHIDHLRHHDGRER